MNKLRVEKRSSYVIEVNDKGETIEFNVEDPSLPLRAEKAFEEVNKIADRCKMEITMLNKQELGKVKGTMLNNRERKQLESYDKMYKEMRTAMDRFLGEGACEKIFGKTNYLTMYDELLEALQPHFEAIGLTAKRFEESIKEKYGAEDEATMELQ